MKKRLVASLAAAMVLGVAGTSFAAANPFVDVPANNWAYDSVKTLAKAGIVDGYADGKFMGDKTITRYEMAQIVAKAMAKEDKADAKQKAAIDKLAVEFADELNKIGVRLAAVEAKQGNIKFSGDARLRYVDQQTGSAVGSAKYAERVRIQGNADLNDNLSFYFRDRIIDQGQAFGGYTLTKGQENAITDANFTYHTPDFNLTAGRFSLNLGQTTYLAGSTGGFDGFKGNAISGKGNLLFGYANAAMMDDVAANTVFDLADTKGFANVRNVYFGQYNYAPTSSLNLDVNFLKSQSGVTPNEGNTYADLISIVGAGARWDFAPSLSVVGDYWQNSGSYAKTLAGTTGNLKAYTARLLYKPATLSLYGVNPKLNAGDWGAYIGYNHFDAYTLDNNWTGPNNSAYSNEKYYDAYVAVALAKQVDLEFIYQWDIKAINSALPAPNNGNYTRVQFNFIF
jgi:hypothetical protein